MLAPSPRPIRGMPASKATNRREIRSRSRAASMPEAPRAAETAKESNPRGSTNASSLSIPPRLVPGFELISAWRHSRESATRRRSTSFEIAYAERSVCDAPAGRLGLLLCLSHVGGRVLVHRGDAGEVLRLEGREGDGQIVAQLELGETAEVGEAFAFFLGHVITVGQIHRGDRGVPFITTDLMAHDRGDRIPDVVVVVDRVEGFVLDAIRTARAHPYLQQFGVKDLLLRRGVQFEERRQPFPHRAQSSSVGTADLFQDRKEPALFVMVVEDQLGNVHGALLTSGSGETVRQHTMGPPRTTTGT